MAPGQRRQPERLDARRRVDHRRHPLDPLDLGLHAVGLHHRVHDLLEQRPDREPGLRVEHAQGALALAGRRDDVARAAGADRAPHQGRPGPRVEAAGERGRHVGDDLREGVGEVLGELRARGVPAAAVQRDGDVVAGRGQRALAQPDLADVEAGVAVHGEHGVHAVERPRGDGVVRPAGDDLLGGLEDAAHRRGRARSAPARTP